MKPQPMVCARDVEKTSAWYQQVLGAQSGHGGPEYERILKDGELILQLHHFDADEHSNMGAAGSSPHGFGVSAGPGGVELVRRLTRTLAAIDADDVTDRGGGADISPMRPLGVPQLGLRQDTHYYFDYHHTTADTFDKIDRDDLDRNVAAMAVLAWSLAEIDERLPRLPVEKDVAASPEH